MGLFDKLNVDAVKSAVETGVKSAQEGIANFKPDEALKGATDFVASGAASVGETIGGIFKHDDAATEEEQGYNGLIVLLWCMASADGSITDSERQKLEELARGIDETYSSYAAQCEEDCSAWLQENAAEFGELNATKVLARDVLAKTSYTPVEAKLLCWNLLSFANTDGLNENELEFLGFVSKELGVDEAVFAELKNYNYALVEVGTAREKLKQSNRGYAEIEPLVNEFAQREQVIIEAAQALVFDL